MIESFEKVPVEQVLISGSSGDDIGDLVLKDREMLGNSGIVIISCTLDKDTKEIIGGPEILTRGFVYVKESQELIEKTAEIARNVIFEDTKDSGKRVDYTKIKNDVRAELGNYFYQETEDKPMIITVIQEV
jgi:ribonuclease J